MHLLQFPISKALLQKPTKIFQKEGKILSEDLKASWKSLTIIIPEAWNLFSLFFSRNPPKIILAVLRGFFLECSKNIFKYRQRNSPWNPPRILPRTLRRFYQNTSEGALRNLPRILPRIFRGFSQVSSEDFPKNAPRVLAGIPRWFPLLKTVPGILKRFSYDSRWNPPKILPGILRGFSQESSKDSLRNPPRYHSGILRKLSQ